MDGSPPATNLLCGVLALAVVFVAVVLVFVAMVAVPEVAETTPFLVSVPKTTQPTENCALTSLCAFAATTKMTATDRARILYMVSPHSNLN